MDKYAFLDTLDEEQANNANLIIDGALKRGINPRLAVALAYQESGLRHADKDKVKIGGAKEVGIMQIKPTTAEMMGYKPDQIQILDQNIDAGLDYLKSGFDRYRDPVLAAAGYNAGYDHPYFSNPDKNDLPKGTWNYLESIKGYGGFDEPEEQPEPPPPPVPASESDFRTAKAAAMGALTGGTLGGLADKVFGGRAPAAPPGVPGMAPGAPGAPPPGGLPARVDPSMSGPSAQATRILQGGQGDTLGTTGRARQEGYNIETAQRAANKGEAGKLSPQARQVLANAPGLTSTESGVLYPRTEPRPTAGPRGGPPPSQAHLDIGKIVPGEPTMGAPRPAPPPGAPPVAPTGGQGFRGALSAIGRSPMAMGALSGAGALGGAQEAKTRYDQGDMLGAAVAGIGSLGGLAAAVPHPMTRIVGGGLAMASPAALMLIDQMRQRSAANQQPPRP